jgi:acyl-CoA synthetase (NDP forming)
MTTDLSRLVDPRSIVFIGASDRQDSIAQRALQNLIEHSAFDGALYLVNPKRKEVFERPCLADVSEVPEAPDLAIVTTPADTVLTALTACAARGVAFAIVFTAGFSEVGEAGKDIEAGIKALADRTGMRIYGPNCPGLTNVNKRLGFAFSPAFKTDLRGGSTGLATQGGALGRTIMQSMDRGLGIGLWCSAGNEVDLEISDFIAHMADAPDLHVIAAVLEGVRDGPKFVASALHAARQGKPIVALKIGKSSIGMAATQSHTAAISGSAEVNAAVFQQLGIVEVDDLDELVDVASLFADKRPRGDEKIGIFSMSGGSAALSADMIGLADLELAQFAPETFAKLRELLPSYAAIANPLDTSGNILATPHLLYPALLAVAEDPDVSITLFPIPLDYGKFIEIACEAIIRVRAETGAMIVPVWMSDRTGAGYAKLVAAGIVPIRSLGNAAKAIKRWRAHGQRLKRFDPTWSPLALDPANIAAAGAVRTLTEVEAKAKLAARGLAVPAGRLCEDAASAAIAQSEIGAKTVAKIVCAEITHKSDIGGVRLGLGEPDEAARAFDDIVASAKAHFPDAQIEGVLIERMAPSGGIETFVGVHRDPVFGPMMTFGLGGVYVELFRDVSRRMLPVTTAQAAAMIRETRCFALLNGLRGQGASDIAALEALLAALSDFVCDPMQAVEDIELNPIWVGKAGQGVVALDAVLTLRSDR